MNNLPIGVFDSGIGGLTVLKGLIKELPKESFIYLGDTARVPYGNRDTKTIKKFSVELAKFLSKQKIKALVVACNIMSAVSIPEVKKLLPVPVLGVINPTVEFVSKNLRGKKIGVIGTRATINSKAYDRAFSEFGITVETKACPLFVPLVEEGLFDSKITKLVAETYLSDFRVDAIILGCTHYPFLSKSISSVLGSNVLLIDSAYPTAIDLKNLLTKKNLLRKNGKPTYKIYVTDDTKKTEEIANLFFDNKLPVKLIKVKI